MFNSLDQPLLIIQNIGVFSFALYTLDVFFLITNSLGSNATTKNIMTMSTISVNLLLIPYIVIGVMGYYSFGEYILNIDLFPARPTLLQYNDILMKIGMVLVIFGVCLGNISRFIALKQLLFEIFKSKMTWKKNVIFTICYLYIPSLIGFAYPKVNDWVSLIGGFCKSSLGILMPAIMGVMYYKQKKETLKMCLVLVLGVVWCVLGYTSGMLTLGKMVGLVKI